MPEVRMKVEYDASRFNDAIKAYKANFDLNMGLVLHEQMRLLMQRMLDFMPPAKRSQGVNAVRKDLSKQFVDPTYVYNTLNLKNKKLEDTVKKYIRGKNFDKLNDLSQRTGILGNYLIKPFDKSIIKRDDRGRITQNGLKVLALDKSNLMKYQKQLTDSVGKLKGSLSKPYSHFGGTVPAWTNKDGNGYFIDYSKLEKSPFVEIGSLVAYANKVNTRHNITQKALDARARDITTSIEKNVLNKAQRAYYGV